MQSRGCRRFCCDARELAARQACTFLESLAHLAQARLAPLEHLPRVGLQPRVLLVDLQPHQVNSLVAPGGRELDTGHEAYARQLAGRARFGQARGGVMVGERQHADTALTGARHQPLGRQHAIGVMAVGVKIDQGFGG